MSGSRAGVAIIPTTLHLAVCSCTKLGTKGRAMRTIYRSATSSQECTASTPAAARTERCPLRGETASQARVPPAVMTTALRGRPHLALALVARSSPRNAAKAFICRAEAPGEKVGTCVGRPRRHWHHRSASSSRSTMSRSRRPGFRRPNQSCKSQPLVASAAVGALRYLHVRIWT